MAKQTKEKRVYCNSSGETLLLHISFVYEIDIFKWVPGCYNLEDSRTVASEEQLNTAISIFYKGTIRFTKYTRLVAAPLKWLTENRFSELKQTDNV